MSEWKRYKISDFADVIGGGTPSTKIEEYYGGSIPWLTPKDMSIHNEKYIEHGARNITELGLQKSSARLLPKGTVLFTSRAPIGYIAIAKGEVSTNQGFKSLICDEKIAHNEYIYYLLKSKVKEIESIASGSTFKEVSGKVLKEFTVELPPLQTQKEIAHILSTLDEKIELNRKMNETLEEMAQAIFKSWFVDFEPVHAKAKCKSEAELEATAKELGISKEVLKLFPSEFEESEMGMIPKGWEVKKFGDMVEKYIDNRGKTPPTVEKGIPLLEVKNMPDDMLISYPNVSKYVTEEVYSSWFRSYLEDNDILISTVGTIGKTCIVPQGAKIAIAQNVLGLRFNNQFLNNQFMFYQMKSKRFLHAIDARLVITVQASIKRKDLNTIDILIPPEFMQELFVKQIKPIIEKQQTLENITLQKTRDTLLPKLLSGELDLSKLDLEAGL